MSQSFDYEIRICADPGRTAALPGPRTICYVITLTIVRATSPQVVS